MPPEPRPDRITIEEAAARAGCHHKTIRRWIAAGDLTGYRFGRQRLRVDPAELDAFTDAPVQPRGGDSTHRAAV